VVLIGAIVVVLLGGVVLARALGPKRGRSESDVAADRQPEPRSDDVVRTADTRLTAESSWAEARRLRRALLDRQVPPTVAAWEVVPEEGEVFFYDLGAEYERYYGEDARYSRVPGFFLGSPAFIVAGLAVAGLANSSRQRAAAERARTQWRELQAVRLLVSNHRLLCFVGGRWVSFHYARMNGVYPEVARGALVCTFDEVAPVRFSGIDVPIAAVMTVFATHGLPALAEHPSLRVLD
jgi:hypothetical protein